ncbi:MAG: iron complex transport system ATP-binding protein [Clostridiales bacterium]|nr:iron complex transport system ATP-binding protein [Clostridiales bacterium]
MSIEVSNLGFCYRRHKVLEGVSFDANKGELLSVLGPNGVGKSTLFRCILGLLIDYEGEIHLEGRNGKYLSPKERASLLSYIPQSHNPSFHFSVFDMVLMGTSVQFSSIATPGSRQIRQAEEALERFGILHLKKRDYCKISGGERQLVLLARALVQHASILILDEPTSNLDFGNQVRVLTQMKELAKEGYTIIQSTHNPDQTFQFSDRVLAMKEGRVLAFGKPEEIYQADLMEALYGISVDIQSLYDDKVRVSIPRSILLES